MKPFTRLAGPFAALPIVLSACGSGPFDPADLDEVSITLAISGGLIGQAYSFEVDGLDLEVRGVTCGRFCDFEPGEVLVPLSAAQVADLAGRLEEADVFERSGDYGSECCDQIHHELVYEREGRVARVSGTLSSMPDELAAAIAHIAPLGVGRVPALVAPASLPSDWPRDAYALGDVTVAGLTLSADVSYGGGCSPHAMDLATWGAWLESDPVQLEVLITHDGRGDSCEALISEVREFDLAPIVHAWVSEFGPGTGVPRTVVLRLADPAEGEDSVRLLTLVF